MHAVARYYLDVLSNRTKISLAQFLVLQSDDTLALLCEKHGISPPNFSTDIYYDRQGAVRNWVDSTTEERVMAVMDEMVRTYSTVRSSISPRYRFDERWDDLVRCFELDGYRIDLTARTIRRCTKNAWCVPSAKSTGRPS